MQISWQKLLNTRQTKPNQIRKKVRETLPFFRHVYNILFSTICVYICVDMYVCVRLQKMLFNFNFILGLIACDLTKKVFFSSIFLGEFVFSLACALFPFRIIQLNMQISLNFHVVIVVVVIVFFIYNSIFFFWFKSIDGCSIIYLLPPKHCVCVSCVY